MGVHLEGGAYDTATIVATATKGEAPDADHADKHQRHLMPEEEQNPAGTSSEGVPTAGGEQHPAVREVRQSRSHESKPPRGVATRRQIGIDESEPTCTRQPAGSSAADERERSPRRRDGNSGSSASMGPRAMQESSFTTIQRPTPNIVKLLAVAGWLGGWVAG